MRFIMFSLALMIVGCAAQPTTPKTVVANAPQRAPAAAPATAPAGQGAKIDPEKLVNARKLGYTVVNEGGETMYCRKGAQTGSRIQSETVCLTEKEMEDLRVQTQRTLGNISRTAPPPVGK